MINFRYSILLVGTGGTGSYFLKEFSRFLVGQDLYDLYIRRLALCDGDIVEEHNLQRQAFIEDDIGEKKALALSSAIEESFDVKWNCFPQYLTSKEQIAEWLEFEDSRIIKTSNYTNIAIDVPVIIGCVDNHGCRLICEQFFKENNNVIYFDSANEFTSGEVVFSYKLNGEQKSLLRSEIFPDLKEGDTRNVTEMSCEELNVHSPQHIATNMRAGNLLLVALCALLQEGKTYPGMTFFDIKQMSEEFIPRPYGKKEV